MYFKFIKKYVSEQMTQCTQGWTKKTAFKNFEVIWSV